MAESATQALQERKTSGIEWAGRILTGLISLMLLMSVFMDLTHSPVAVKGLQDAHYPLASMTWIGLALLLGVVLYAFPRTAILGAIILTGYMGGAVATHVQAGNQIPQMCFAIFFGMLIWLGIWLREPRLRALLPLR